MPRVQWFSVNGVLRKAVDGNGVHCKVCDKVINFHPETKQELRHSCQIPDHPLGTLQDDPRWDDDEEDELIDTRTVGARIDQGFDLRGYGGEREAFTGFSERW